MPTTRRLLWSLLVLSIASRAVLGFDHTHAGWEGWLKKYVVVKGPVSSVNYKGAKKAPAELTGYLSSVGAVTKEDYAKFSEPQKLAFLINAYNAFTVKLILDNYPVKSIKDLGGTFSSPWKKKFFKLFGEEQSLDGIEHENIRKYFNEPRIHFSVVCASKGCPALSNEAFRAEKLEAQFGKVASVFLSDPARNRYDKAKNELKISKIFQWYGDDFKKKYGSVQEFVGPYFVKTPDELAKIKKADIDTFDYDWTLNEASSGANG